MSRKKASAAGWESDEENLLNDGGISAFKTEDDEIDEEALLGLGGDDEGDINYLEDDLTRDDGQVQDSFGEQQEELLEIGVDEEEINELAGEEESGGDRKMGVMMEEEEEVEQLDYVDDLPQVDEPDVHIEYDENVAEASVSEADLSQEEASDAQQVSINQSSLNEMPIQIMSAVETKESESDSEDSDGDKSNRGRFKNERSNIVNVSKVKSRTDIPDTLEVSAEQQAQIDQFPGNRQRGQNRYDRGRGRDQNRRGFLHGNRQDHNGTQQSGGPIRVNRMNSNQQGGNLRHTPMGTRPIRQQGIPMNRMPIPRVQGQRGPFRGQAGIQVPGPLLGNRMLGPNQGRGLGMVQLEPRGPTPLISSQMPPPGTPTSIGFGTPPPRPGLQHQPVLSQPSVFRPGVPGAPVRPHNIHINPNFRANVPPPRLPVSSMASVGQQQPPLLSQPSMSHTVRMATGMDSAPPLLQGQAQPFGQPRGFQQGVPVGLHPNQQGGDRPGQPQQQQPRFMSSGRGMGQPGMMTSPVKLNLSPSARFPSQRLPPPHSQAQFSGFNNPPPTSVPMSHQAPPPVQPFSAPQQGVYRGPSPQQQLRQQQPQHPGMYQRRVGTQQSRTVNPQNNSTVTAARKLSQQAKIMQKAKVSIPSVNKNITVVPLKRHSSSKDDNVSPGKVAKLSGDAAAVEPDDEELRRGLEEQKRLREMIRKRKEEARRQQAEARRRELESRLKEKGMSIEDLEGDSSAENTQPPTDAGRQTSQGAQRIKTVVSRGGKKHLVTPTRRAQMMRSQQQQQQQQLQQDFQHQPHPSAAPPGQLIQGQQMDQPPPPLFSSPPPVRQPPPQQQQNPGVFNHPGFNQQRFPPPRPTVSPAPRPQQPVHQVSPVAVPPPPFRHPSRQPAPQQMGPPNHYVPNEPQQRFAPPKPGGVLGTPRQVQQTNSVTRGGLGRGAALGMARGKVANVRVQVPQGRGQVVVRGRDQMVRGGGMSAGWGRGQVLANAPQPGTPSSPSPQPSSNRTVLPVGRGRVITRGGAVTPTPGRTVVERQVVTQPPLGKAMANVPGPLQNVSVDNLAAGTSEQQIRQSCEAIGPVLGIVMIESQRKAIVTFANRSHATLFFKQWNRRMVNMSVISVTLLP